MSKEKDNKVEDDAAVKASDRNKKCGVIMPIADNIALGYPAGHWNEVLNIIGESLVGTDFEPRLVSQNDAVRLIHQSIVTNVYSDEIVVCDVSSKNPNVMFELGMRLAFDKPVIIIKDDKTDYSFDTGPIEHLKYPSSLRFKEIVEFKGILKEKVVATYKASKSADYPSYLKGFNKVVPGKIGEVQVTDVQYLIDKMENISYEVNRLSNTTAKEYRDPNEGSSTRSERIKERLFQNVLIVAMQIRTLLNNEIHSLGFEEAYQRVIRDLPKDDIEMYGTQTIREVLKTLKNIQ